jgi:hypothetical protein
MAYTTPTTAAGQVLTSAIWNASVRDNITHLYTYGPNRARAEVTHNATQSIATGSLTALSCNVENVDAFGMHDTATNNTRLTVPTGYDGWWLVTAYFAFASNATGGRQGQINVGGGTVATALSTPALNGSDHQFSLATLVRLVAGNYVEVLAYQTSGGALNVQPGPLFRAVWLSDVG